MKRLIAGIFAGLMCMASGQAAMIAGSAKGHVTNILTVGIGMAPAGIATGDEVFIRWEYESAMSAGFTTPTRAIYRPGPGLLSIKVEIRNYDWIASGGKIEISNGDSLGDRISIFADEAWQFESFPGDLGGFSTLGAFHASSDDVASTLLKSLLLPDELGDIDLGEAKSISHVIASEAPGFTGKWMVVFAIDGSSVRLAPVPEPSTLVCLFFGAIALCRLKFRRGL